MSQFVGRDEEFAELERFAKGAIASLIVIRGRRRIGKSRLIEEFAKKRDGVFYSFTGLFPTEETTAQAERDEFARQLSAKTGFPKVKADDWSDLFSLLFERVKEGRVTLLFDEISWMGSEDSNFLSKVKLAWDTQFKKNPKLIFFICGSASSWIEKNILSSAGFLGRVSHTLTLHELPAKDCDQFWRGYSKNISAYEKLKVLSVTGGVPRYLEAIDPKISAEENIKNLCFKPGALLVNEFNNIFSDLFLHNTSLYKGIIKTLASGPKEASEICNILKISQAGNVSEYLEELALAGFVQRDWTWHIKNGEDSKLSKYRLSDNYLRFYLKYIEKNRKKIERGAFDLKTLTALPEWYAIIGLQFENLVINNRRAIHTALRLRPEAIVSNNPFFQKTTTKQPGCQIDYMIQTKFDTLYVCEIKSSKNPIGLEVVEEVRRKIKRLKLPKGFSVRPVLIHSNHITEDVTESDFFSSIIDFSQLLESKR